MAPSRGLFTLPSSASLQCCQQMAPIFTGKSKDSAQPRGTLLRLTSLDTGFALSKTVQKCPSQAISNSQWLSPTAPIILDSPWGRSSESSFSSVSLPGYMGLKGYRDGMGWFKHEGCACGSRGRHSSGCTCEGAPKKTQCQSSVSLRIY